jgi:hypothetical protein
VTYRYDRYRRLAPAAPFASPDGGFGAQIADPAWFLGRQWQLGEHRGEDAASPVGVEFDVRLARIGALHPGYDPRLTPSDAALTADPASWWTIGRRVELGRSVAATAAGNGVDLPDDRGLDLPPLPPPYDEITGLDGRTLYRRRVGLGLQDSWFDPEPPVEPEDHWDPAEFSYDGSFPVPGGTLAVVDHPGGQLEWYAADATGTPAAEEPARHTVIPSRLRYPGAPLPRWWEIEDVRTDPGGYPPDRAHFASLLLVEAMSMHTDDWYTFPVPAEAGAVIFLDGVLVRDSFGDTWQVQAPADGWSLFGTRGLPATALTVWQAADAPLTGPVSDEIVVVVDEDANLVWAVERRVDGRELVSAPAPEAAPDKQPDEPRAFAYQPGGPVPERWHPYRAGTVDGRRRFVQARLADLSGHEAVLTPEPIADLLGGGGIIHTVEPAAVPARGLLLERRPILTRRTDGLPVLWTARRQLPASAQPSTSFRFDALTAVAS